MPTMGIGPEIAGKITVIGKVTSIKMAQHEIVNTMSGGQAWSHVKDIYAWIKVYGTVLDASGGPPAGQSEPPKAKRGPAKATTSVKTIEQAQLGIPQKEFTFYLRKDVTPAVDVDTSGEFEPIRYAHIHQAMLAILKDALLLGRQVQCVCAKLSLPTYLQGEKLADTTPQTEGLLMSVEIN